jgi:hypothetical protein
MTKPSKGGAAFLIAFGMMFLLPGLLFLTSLRPSPNGSPAGVIAAAGIALFISAIGAGLILAGWYGYRN